MATESLLHDEHALYQVKGMLTKFMRMIYPLEFRIDSLPESGATLPFHYPLIGGEMIYLPESVSGIGGVEMTRDYFVLTAAHLAGRRKGHNRIRYTSAGTCQCRSGPPVEGCEETGQAFEERLRRTNSSLTHRVEEAALHR